MSRSILPALAENGDVARVREELHKAKARGDRKLINTPDREGYTPLMRAVMSGRAGVDMVRELIAHGARIIQGGEGADESRHDVMRLALSGGDPTKIKTLLDAGADLSYRTAKGYDALIDAVYGRDLVVDRRLIELLRLLLAEGAAVSGQSRYGETCLRRLSATGRFDGVTVLLDAGADRDQLNWSALHEAVALGAIGDVEAQLRAVQPLENLDHHGRTPWLLAVQCGDVAKAELLQDHGADMLACGPGGRRPLQIAVAARQARMLRWLIDEGHDVDGGDDFGKTPLIESAQCDNAEALDILLVRGADVDREQDGQTALNHAATEAIARRLLDAGADPQRISEAGRRALCGFKPDPDTYALAAASDADFVRACAPRFGAANPEEIHEPFLHAMVRSGVNAYGAKQWFSDVASRVTAPVWCAKRFGQSLTFLPDGRVVEIAGEHEDYYDPDFCIYNDVFVHGGTGGMRIFAYPRSVFPPTDFHTATLIGDFIYVIGSLGYKDQRDFGRTPVFRLDVRDWSFEEVGAEGDAPGWIHRHRAKLIAPHEIEITGGTVLTGESTSEANMRPYVLDLKRKIWRTKS